MNNKINGGLNEAVKEGYNIIDRENEIDNLIIWISECGHNRESEREMMKEDLKMLLSWTCKNIYSSDSTNDYLEINI